MAKKLTDTQLVILSQASQRTDGAVLPLPETLTLNKGSSASVLKGLLKRNLIAERPIEEGEECWREASEGQRLGLAITDEALELLGIAPTDGTNSDTDEKPKRPARSKVAQSGTKQAMLVDLLKRKRGASIEEVMERTGWQAHSIRGAISGTLKKKLGLDVTSEKVDGRGRVYRIVGQA